MKYRIFFSKRLSKLRKEKKLSLARMGEQLGVSAEAVRLMECAKRSPSFEVLCAVADYFGVSTDYLLGRGVFENWEKIMEPKIKAGIIAVLEEQIEPLKQLHLDVMDEYQLMKVLPTFLEMVKISEDGKRMELTYKI